MGLILPKPCLSKVVERAGNEYCGAASSSLNGYRTSMEDTHIMHAPLNGEMAFFGIFDGHGGARCSAYLAEKMPARLSALKEPISPKKLELLCQEVDQEFTKLDGSDGGSAATFCLLSKNKKLLVVNVGDSRTLHCRQGTLRFATEDHKPTLPMEEKRIREAGGSVMNGRVDGDLALSRAFGDGMYKTHVMSSYETQKVIAIPDVTELTWEPGDIIIVACDGVFEGGFTNEEVSAFVHKEMKLNSGDLAVTAVRLCDEAIRKGSKDNVSCIILQMSEGSSKVQQFGKKSFVPGPPFVRNHEPSRTCYEHMATLGGHTLPDALRLRYELFQAKTNQSLESKPPVLRTAFEMSDSVDIATEQNFFGLGPSRGQEDVYFRSLAKGSPQNSSGPVPRPVY